MTRQRLPVWIRVLISTHVTRSGLLLDLVRCAATAVVGEMGIPSDLRDAWASKRSSPVIMASSPDEQRSLESKNTTREAVQAGFKTASIAGAVASVPVLVGCRTIPWAKANLNYTAQALLISAAAIAGFFIAADRTILENARGNTIGKLHDKQP